LLESIDIIRSDYGYTDEYILQKTFAWLRSSVHLISRRNYNDKVQLAHYISISVWNLFAKKEDRVELQTFDELQEGQSKLYGNHDDTFIDEKTFPIWWKPKGIWI